MRYGYTIIYVDDVSMTLHFYETAFGFKKKFVTPEGDYGELVSGDTVIAFASISLGKSNFPSGFTPVSKSGEPVGIEMAFVTEEIERDFAQALAAGADLVVDVTTKSWGQKVGYLRDNNGMLIELCTPINNSVSYTHLTLPTKA